MKYTIVVLVCGLFIIPIFADASGISPTGCAMIFTRIDVNTFKLEEIDADIEVATSPLINSITCRLILSEAPIDIGGTMNLDSYEKKYITTEVGGRVWIPVSKIWNSPGPNGQDEGSLYQFDFYRAKTLVNMEVTTVEPKVVYESILESNEVAVASATEATINDEFSTREIKNTPVDVSTIADSQPPTNGFRDSILYEYVVRFLYWIGIIKF